MASRHLPRVLHNLPDRRVTVQEGDQKTEHPGSLTVSEVRGRESDGEAVTITLAADPTAAREQAMSVSLSAADAAALESALAEAGEEG